MAVRLVEDVARVFQRHVPYRDVPGFGQALVSVSKIRGREGRYGFSARLYRPGWILKPLSYRVVHDVQRVFSSYERRQRLGVRLDVPLFSFSSDASGRRVSVHVRSRNLDVLRLYHDLFRTEFAIHSP